MKMNRLSMLLLGGAMACAHAGTPDDYAYAFALQMDSAPEHGSAWRVDLTADVYRWVQDPALRDIEIFNGAGEPVPIARWMTPKTRTAPHLATLPTLALPGSPPDQLTDLHLVIDRDENGRLRRLDASERTAAARRTQAGDWLLDASSFDHPIERIELSWSTPDSGVVARFALAASDDLQQWRSLGNASVVALQREGAQLERRHIALDAVRAKYIRLHRLDDGPKLIGLRAQARSSEQAGAASPRAWLDLTAEAPDGRTANPQHFHYRLPAGLPVDAVHIQLGETDTLAPLVLRHRPSGQEWRQLALIDAFRLHNGSGFIENERIRLSGPVRTPELQIESAVPLAEAPRVTLGYRPDSFVFLAEGAGPYRLAAGSVHAKQTAYPVDAALAGVRAKLGQDWQPPLVSLGAMRESAGPTALVALPPPTPWRRWLLWGVLAIGAAVVGGVALSLLRGANISGRPSD